MFADDVVLIAKSNEHLSTLYNMFSEFCTKHGMVISMSKTKLLLNNRALVEC